MTTYEEQLETYRQAINVAHDKADSALLWHKRGANKELSQAYRDMYNFIDKSILQADVAYIANHINELEESDFVSPFDYSNDVDKDVEALLKEYGI